MSPMTTYIELKSVKYIDRIVQYAEVLLGIQFHSTGKYRYSSHCPFHADRKDSFRIYVDGKDEVRFHCFGACNGDWDIYDVIMLRNKCRFRKAQDLFTEYLGIEDFKPYDGTDYSPAREIGTEEPDEPVVFIEPKELDADVLAALESAEIYYHELLLENQDRFNKVSQYLRRRGLDIDIIRAFKIGYAPPLTIDSDDPYYGRALIEKHIDLFNEDYRVFNHYARAGLVRLLNDASQSYYRRFIDFTRDDAFTKNYSDYFAGRITFPIHDIDGRIHGFMGRKPINRGLRWVKQQTERTDIRPREWLYGIDRAAKSIQGYNTIIIVEGIFDYFAFYKLLQDENKPIVVSTLGSRLTDEASALLQRLNVKHIIVAFDWDDAGRAGIKRIADAIDGNIYYLGCMKQDEDPADKLKDVVNSISGFSLRHLSTAAAKIQKQTSKPVGMSFLSTGSSKEREVIFTPGSTIDATPVNPPQKSAKLPSKYYYDRDRFLPLLSYDHGNKAALDDKIQSLIKMLNEKPPPTGGENEFFIYGAFIVKEYYDDLGPALILWLRLVIEQQRRKKRIKETDATIAGWLKTTRFTVIKYKNRLKDLGFLNINTMKKFQVLSVKYSPGK